MASASISGGNSGSTGFTSNMPSGMLIAYSHSGSASGTTSSAISEGALEIRDPGQQKQDVATLSHDVEHANDSISPIFDKEKEQRRLQQVQLIGEIGTQVSDIVRTEGLRKAKEEAKAELAKQGIYEPEKGADQTVVTAYQEQLAATNAYQTIMGKYGTGGDYQKVTQAVAAALQGLAGGNIGGALAGASAPYLAGVIKQVAGDNGTARVMAHAVLGAVVAQAQGNSAIAGAAGAAGGELAAQVITRQLYGTSDPHSLSEEQKQTVAALSTLAAGFAGAIASGDGAGAIAGAGAGKNAVENNHLSLDGRMYLKQLEREYALACGGAAGASGECQEQADEIRKLRRLGDSVLETEHIVVGSDMGPDHSIANQPGDIVACANSVNGFCQVTGEAIETPAGKEWKLVAATDTEAAEQTQRNKEAVERANLAARKLALEAFESGCNGVGISATACQLYKALGGANPISGYEPTTNERLLAGAGAILNALGLVGAIRGGGLSGSAAESSIDSGAKGAATSGKNVNPTSALTDAEAGVSGLPKIGSLKGEPELPPKNASPEMVRSIDRQNEASKKMAQAGYDVEQLPNTGKNVANPDLRINGELADVYSPITSSPISVLKTVAGKVKTQANNIVVSLADSPLTFGQIEKALSANPVDGLKKLYLMKGGEFKVIEVAK
ncbi:VENN motif pre-toxin domain-containing protein [Pseudomonas fakonensis]|uniref:VENN motif pre-toxin domain-containing protein n=1 Tax=Pseudomonas fakonensis TaxID=2842355 RepID=UPI001CED1BE6|nr:VENN motif pre-toxin domain-containing protein [Pseudomonas fakonensis]